MTDIFISYAQLDRDRVSKIAQALEDAGWSVWWDARGVAGDRLDDMVDRELANAKCVVVVWSTASIKSDWVLGEADEGREKRILVPVTIDGVEPVRRFRQLNTVSLKNWKGGRSNRDFQRLLDGIRALVRPRAVSNRQANLEYRQARPEPLLFGEELEGYTENSFSALRAGGFLCAGRFGFALVNQVTGAVEKKIEAPNRIPIYKDPILNNDFVVLSGKKALECWDLQTGKIVKTRPAPRFLNFRYSSREWHFSGQDCSADGEVWVRAVDGQVVFKRGSRRLRRVEYKLSDKYALNWKVAVSFDGTLAAVSKDVFEDKIVIYDTKTGKEKTRVQKSRLNDEGTEMCFSANGRFFAAGGFKPYWIGLWDTEQFDLVWMLEESAKPVGRHLKFVVNDDFLMVGLSLFRTSSGEELKYDHDQLFFPGAISIDGTSLLVNPPKGNALLKDAPDLTQFASRH